MSSRSWGTKLWRKSTSFAPRRSGFDSRRLHYGVATDAAKRLARLWRVVRFASVVSTAKHAPFVRPRCGFDSCRRLLLVAVAQRRLRRGVQVRGRSSAGRAPERHFGEARSIRVARFPQARGVSGSTASSNLAGPGSSPGGPALHDRRGPERLGYHGDDPQPGDDDARRRPRAGLGPHVEGGRAARRP
jgi:hypothetical protein